MPRNDVVVTRGDHITVGHLRAAWTELLDTISSLPDEMAVEGYLPREVEIVVTIRPVGDQDA